MKIVEIFKGAIDSSIKNYKKNVLIRYEEDYKPEILSNYNKESEFYRLNLCELKDGKIVPYNYSERYYMLRDDYMITSLYGIKTNGVLTELFSAVPVAVSSEQASEFNNLKIEELESLDKNYFYVQSIEKISKETMAKELVDMRYYKMIRYYNDIFKIEKSEQSKQIDAAIEKKKNDKYIESHADEIIGGFVKKSNIH